MRSLHISDLTDSGGAEVVFNDTVAAARELGHQVETLVTDGKRSPFSYVFSVKWYLAVRRKLRSFRPDVAHLHNYHRFLSPSVLLALRGYARRNPGFRVVFTAHDYHLVCPNSGNQIFDGDRAIDLGTRARLPRIARYDDRSNLHGILKIIQHVVAYRILRLHHAIDLIVAPSQILAEVFSSRGLSTPIDVVRNPVRSFVEIDSEPNKHALVYLGRVAPEKGLREFIETVEASSTSMTLAVYGAGVSVPDLRGLAEECRHITVEVNEPIPRLMVPSTLAAYAAFIYPSRWIENAPIAVIEAIIAGLPVVAPAGTGAEEMATLGTVHFSYRRDDPAELLSAVKNALDCTTRNRLRNPDDFSFENYVKRLGDAYQAPDV